MTLRLQLDREARVKEAISKLEKETRDRQNEEAQKAREIEDLKKEKKEREESRRSHVGPGIAHLCVRAFISEFKGKICQ